MANAADKEQVEQARRVQKLLLDSFENMLKDGSMTPTDRSTLTRFLERNGWTLDPSMLPDHLRDMVHLPAVDEGLEGERIIDIASRRQA